MFIIFQVYIIFIMLQGIVVVLDFSNVEFFSMFGKEEFENKHKGGPI